MSFALRAAVLVILQGHSGTWCSLHYLVGRVVRPIHEVEAVCDDLVANREAQVARDTLPDGSRCFGIDCPPDEVAESAFQPSKERC